MKRGKFIKTLFVSAVLFFLILLIIVWSVYSNRVEISKSPKNGNSVTTYTLTINTEIEDHLVTVKLARTDAERQKGLMGVKELSPSEGMFFIFENDIRHGFWMKDTLIPLDMIFIDRDLVVVDINKNAQPCKQTLRCPSYVPEVQYRYVLELNGGQSDVWGIRRGDSINAPFLTSY